MNVERRLCGLMLNAGTAVYGIARAHGVSGEMMQDRLAREIWAAAERLAREGPGQWDGPALLAAVDTTEDLDGLLQLVQVSVVGFPEDVARPLAREVVAAHGKRQLLDALAAYREVVERDGDEGAVWAQLLERKSAAGRVRRLSFVSGEWLLAHRPPPKTYVLEPLVAAGEMCAVVGPPGCGKSRLVLSMLAAAVAGEKSFGTLPIPSGFGDGRFLIVSGNENGRHRLTSDLEELCAAYPSAKEELPRRFRFHKVEGGDKPFDFAAWGDVLEEVREMGDCLGVVLDTLSDATPPGESLNDDATMKALCVHLRDTLKQVAPRAFLMLLHHARGGREQMARAVDPFEAGECGRNSKLLAGTCRAVLNVVPLDGEGGVVCQIGKLNDAKKPPAFAMRKVPGAGYAPVEDFNLEQWLEQTVGKRNGGGARGHAPQYGDDGRELETYFPGEVPVAAADLVTLAEKGGMGRRRLYDLLGRAVKSGWLVQVRRGVYRRAE